MDFISRNWGQLTPVVAGIICILVGVLDAETRFRFGIEWDRGLVTFGVGLLGGVSVPLVQRSAASLRAPTQ